jgi:hypothetical protein
MKVLTIKGGLGAPTDIHISVGRRCVELGIHPEGRGKGKGGSRTFTLSLLQARELAYQLLRLSEQASSDEISN